MDLAGRYTDLRTESVTESVRKSGGDISVDACGIHYLHKVFRRLIIFGQNRIRVVGSETVNVFAGLFHTRNELDGNNELQILCPEVFLPHDLARNNSGDFLTSANLHTCIIQSFRNLRQELLSNSSVHQQSLDRIACCRILALGIDYDRYCLLHVAVLVCINMADSVRVPHDRYLRVIHDIADKAIRSARNQKIHISVAAEQLVDLIVKLRLKHTSFRKSGFTGSFVDDSEEYAVGLGRFLATLQDRTVSAL